MGRAPKDLFRSAGPATEAVHHRAADLDLCSIREIVHRLHQEDLAAIEAVGRVLPSITEAAERARELLAAGGRLFYVGAGTSGRLGVLDATECPPTFGTSPDQVQAVLAGGDAALTAAVEGAEDDPAQGSRDLKARGVAKGDLVVGISASSTTPYVLGALKEAKRVGAATVLVCCNPSLVKPGTAQILIAPQTGPEIVAGSTRLKAGTATKLVLNALSTSVFVSLGKVFQGRMVDLHPTNAKLRARAERTVMDLGGVDEAEARKLLAKSDGSVRVALAMAFTGLDRAAAERSLQKRDLRSLARGRRSSSSAT